MTQGSRGYIDDIPKAEPRCTICNSPRKDWKESYVCEDCSLPFCHRHRLDGMSPHICLPEWGKKVNNG